MPGAAAANRNGDQPRATLDRMIGQMIMVGFVGVHAGDRGVGAVLAQLRKGQIGGVILMGRNIRSPRQLRRLTSLIAEAAKEGGQPPPLIAVDQEGGYVQRLKKNNGYEKYLPARTIAEQCTPAQAEQVYRRLACRIHEAGINMNFGPVVDLDIMGNKNPIIGRFARSFSADANTVVRYAKAFSAAHKTYGLLTVAKHFPGHGSSLTDTHKQFTDISQTWRMSELEPYEKLAKQPFADMVMTGHLYHPRFSDDRAPASLSKKAIRDELRGKIGFQGVVITDDLQMRAVLDTYPLHKRIPMAVNAGNDIVLLSNTVRPYPALGAVVHSIIRRNVREACPDTGAQLCIERKTIAAAYARVRALKSALRARAEQPARCDAAMSVRAFVARVCTKPADGGAPSD